MSATSDETPKGLTEHQNSIISLLQGPALEVVVGSADSNVTWNLPKDLVTKYSDFFKAACRNGFKEGIENKVALPNVTPEAFKLFVQWLYYGKIMDELDCLCMSPHFGPIFVDKRFCMWILGDQLLACEFKNYAMGIIWDDYLANPGQLFPEEIRYCWNCTTTTSKLRFVLIDVMSMNLGLHIGVHNRDVWKQIFDRYPDLQQTLLFRLAEKAKRRPKDCYMEE